MLQCCKLSRWAWFQEAMKVQAAVFPRESLVELNMMLMEESSPHEIEEVLGEFELSLLVSHLLVNVCIFRPAHHVDPPGLR